MSDNKEVNYDAFTCSFQINWQCGGDVRKEKRNTIMQHQSIVVLLCQK